MKTELIEIKRSFAKYNNLPHLFVGKVLVETARAVYVYGYGSMDTAKTGRCCVCGRSLTHPVSVVLGIGPECGGHWWDWNTIGGYSMENIERLKQEMTVHMKNMLVDTWMPKSVIIEMNGTEEAVDVPADHKMLKKKDDPKTTVRQATMVSQGDEHTIMVTFPYNKEDVSRIREIPFRRWNPDNKSWNLPLNTDVIAQLLEWDFKLDEKLEKFYNRKTVNVEDMADEDIPGLKMELFPYQKKGVSFIDANDGRALIADEMGLGKTAQALAWLQKHPKKRPALIVVPASLKLNWKKEIGMWMGKETSVTILSGTKPRDIWGAGIYIINYDILSAWLGALLDHPFEVLIADEAHYVKNNKAVRTKAFKKLAKAIPNFIALTGTPIVNRPVEMLNAIKLIDPMLFPRSWDYIQRYCAPKNNGYGWDLTGADNTEELHKKLTNSIMIRRKKADVLTELPDKMRAFTPVFLDNISDYSRAESDFISFLKAEKGEEAAEKASNAEVLATIEGLKQLAVKGKMKEAIDWIEDFLDSGEKLVVFATHKFVIEELMSNFGDKAVKVDGSVSGSNRQAAVDLFQEDPSIRLFVGNIKAAGVGLTLTAASNVAFLELPWTPGDLTQAEDRIHRIGQKNACTIHYLLAQGTIEEKIAEMLDEKRKILDSVLDGKTPDEGSLLTQLMELYKAA